MTRSAAIIVAAGRGERCGGGVPKQFAPLGGRAMLDWSIAACLRHPRIDEVVVVLPADDRRELPGVRTVAGGASRRESVANGLAAIDAERVLVHDAARPFLPAAVIDRLLDALNATPGAVPVLPVADTLALDEDGLGPVVPRETLRRIQTPQAFDLATLRRAHRDWAGGEATDDSQMVRALGGRVALVQGDAMLEKVTYPEDFARAEAMLGWETRSASGFDVHRLVDGEELWLGGVLIPHSQGLSGHSDADVALHAITDAVLGTIAAGDIGQHFPPSDPQWRGAASDQFLRHAIGLVAEAGGQLTFVDLTLMCEAPKIGPHREALRHRIAEICGLPPSRVSVKATTTEKLGFTGRGEGIAAQAVATIRLPGWRP